MVPDCHVLQTGGARVCPVAVGPLIAVKGAKRHGKPGSEGIRRSGDLGTDLIAALLPQLRPALETHAALVDKIDHVGVSVPAQAERERNGILPDEPTEMASPPLLGTVVEIDDETASHINEQDAVLVVVSERHDLDVAREGMPLVVLQDRDVESPAAQVIDDPTPHVVGKQNVALLEQR